MKSKGKQKGRLSLTTKAQQQLQKNNLENELLAKDKITIPVSYESFLLMILLTTIFVDKTLFLKSLLERLTNQKSYIITRPKRWGKSMLLSMLYYFFTNIQTTRIKEQQKFVPYRTLFEGGNVIYLGKPVKLKKLQIANQTNYFNQYQGKHPVIQMNWSGIAPQSFQSVFIGIRRQISNAFKTFKFVLQKMSQEDRDDYNRFLKQNVDQLDITKKSLKFLSQCLVKYYNSQVVILIDEYDHVYHHMLAGGSIQKKKEIKKTGEFLTVILEYAFKHNPYLLCGVATGLYDILTKSQSGLNNTLKDTIASPHFVDAYGLSEKEIREQLLAKMFKKETSDKKSQQEKIDQIMINIYQWYDGYFYLTNQNKFQKYYNPFSVIKYLWQNCILPRKILRPTSFWTLTSNEEIIKNVFSTAFNHQLFGKMLELYQKPEKSQPVNFKYNKRTNLSKINDEIQSDSENYISYLLLHTGYVTGTFTQHYLSASLANFEIYSEWRSSIESWMNSKWLEQKQVDLTKSTEIIAFMYNTYKLFKKNLGKMNEKSFNSFFYVGFMIGTSQTHVVSSQCYSSPNYLDHIYNPIDKRSDAIIIHELKYQENYQNKEKMSQNALWQIFQKDYMNLPLSELKNESFIKRIIVRGITIVYREPFGKRYMIIDISPDQEFSIHQAQEISQFFKKYKQYPQKLQTLKNQFFQKLEMKQQLSEQQRENKKSLLYILIVKMEKKNENNISKKNLRSRKQSKKHNVRCLSEEIDIFEKSQKLQVQNTLLNISYQFQEQQLQLYKSQNEDQVKEANFLSQEKIEYFDKSLDEVQWEKVNINSLSEDKSQQLEKSQKKVEVEGIQSNIRSQSQQGLQFTSPIKQTEINKNLREGESEKLNLPGTRVSLKKRTQKQFNFTKQMFETNQNNSSILPEKGRIFFNAAQETKNKNPKD